jgi:branched-chain amino acid transport system substrate-binding protein
MITFKERRRLMKKMHLSRRDFLKTTAIGGIGLAAGMGLGPRIARSAEKGPIAILNLEPFSGAYADTGLDVSRGVRFAIEEFGGKVLGREIKLIERDATNPSDSVRRSKEVVEKEGCKFIQVGTSSSVALAVAEYGAKNEVMVGCHAGADKITGEACNKFTFRWAVPTYGAVREVVPRLIKELKVNTFYTITPEYVFGEDLLRNTKEVLKEQGKELLGNSYHPLGETEYSAIITKAMAAKADCVLFLNFGGDTVNAIKQAVNFGLKKVSKLCIAWSGGQTEFMAMGTKVLEDIWVGIQYYHTIDTPMNKRVVEAYRKKYGVMMPYVAASGYQQMKVMLEAIKRAKSTDVKKVIAAWEDYEYEALTGREVYRKCDHQCIKPYYTVRCKSEAEKKAPDDFAEIVGFSKNFLPCDKTGCKM